jgi:hypothetical protein
MSCGGSMKKMQKGGAIKKKPLSPAPKPKTGMDALKALYEHVTTFGGATKKDNPKQKDINIVKKLKETFSSTKKPMKKMELGGTTTKRIIKKSTGGMYGIPQENLGTSGQYGFAKKGGATKAAKFAALAPPYDKATFADKIVGAKKSAGSKKLPKAQLGGILKLAIRATKPLTKTLKPVAKKIVSKSKTTATKKFNYPKDKVKSMFPRVAEDVKKFNSETNSQKLFERKTIKEQMKQWDKAAELKQQKKYPVLKNKN